MTIVLTPLFYAYHAGSIVLFGVWLVFFLARKNLHKEMLTMSVLIGVLSVLTRDQSNMEIQMRQTYVNAKKILGEFGATLDNVVEEVLYVTDMDRAFASAGPVRKEMYGSQRPEVASTIVVTPRLALPTQLIEIRFVANVR